MPALELGAVVRSAALKSADGKTIISYASGYGPLSQRFDECFSTSHTAAVIQDLEPPRKRMRLSTDVEVGEARSTQRSIPIARISVELENGDKADNFSTDTGLACRGDEPDTTLRSLAVGLIKVEGDNDRLGLTLVLPSIKKKGNHITLELEHCMSDQDVKDLQQVASLERKSKAASKNGVVQHTCHLSRRPSATGKPFIFALDIHLTWPDGMSASVPQGSNGNLDTEILSRYYPEVGVPLIQDQLGRPARTYQGWSPQEFYDSVHAPPNKRPIPALLRAKVLENDLYPFQKRAVGWMLEREGVDLGLPDEAEDDADHVKPDESVMAHSPPGEPSHLSFRKDVDAENQECYVSHLIRSIASRAHMDRFYEPKGGILAEEMGLGKTCELISLICLNKRPAPTGGESALLESQLERSGATLIVTPTTILEQWKYELSKHAPHLSWMHYQGMASVAKSGQDENEIVRSFLQKDVVLTTYAVLAREVHFAVDPPDRSLRKRTGKQPPRPRSPLVQVHWWRVCLDEAQMVESGVSAAATVAALIPRENAWAVSGTPVKKDVQDLRGLLIFLRYEPFASSSDIWKRLLYLYKAEFKELFGRIALRHTKDRIRQELRLPPQRRIVITVPFTAIEEQNYKTLFEEMAAEVGCSTDGSPLNGDWDPNSSRLHETMRQWLVRLRQTCLHPQVGGRNRRALGRGAGPLRTVAEVLEVMIDQNETGIRAESRLLLQTQLQRAHIIGNARDDDHRAEKALELHNAALKQANALVDECRSELRSAGVSEEEFDDLADDDKTIEQKAGVRLRANLRSALELQHSCYFYVGTAYFQIKSNPALTEENSDRFRELEEDEIMNYDRAKTVRKELLKANTAKTEELMQEIHDRKDNKSSSRLPSLASLNSTGGIENRKLLNSVHHLDRILGAQTKLISEWRSKVIDLAVKPLVDKDEEETTGEEYEDSTKQQDEMYAYFDALRAVVADRSTCLSGQVNILINHEMNVLGKEAQDEKGHAPKLLLELLGRRNEIRQREDEMVSLRGLIHEARSVETALQWQEGKSGRADAELHIVRDVMKQLQTISTAEAKVLTQLEKDQDLVRSAMNQRLEFYRQLQIISDSVAPYKEDLDETLDTAALEAATTKSDAQAKSLAALKTKHRFLIHLRHESHSEAQRICVICQSGFEQGVLTICGHQYCKECITLWWSAHRTCPVCKRKLNLSDFHNITYKPQEIRGQMEARTDPNSPERSRSSESNSSDESNGPDTAEGASKEDTSGRTSIYTDMSTATMNAIKSISLPSSTSYGTKIDTLARHMLYLRATEPGSQSILFSQFREFLDVLGTALSAYGITYTRMGRANAVESFRAEDSGIECFLLDAKTDSSGLNLVNATHVFLCEPLVNSAIELQAVARVHRIGQRRPTSVYMYLIRDTVEEGIYEISVRRRLALMQQPVSSTSPSSSSHIPSGSATPRAQLGESAIDKADSMQLQQAPLSRLLAHGKGSGEMVQADDLWNCLFSAAAKNVGGGGIGGDGGSGESRVLPALEAEVDRHLRAEAADGRRMS